MNRGIERIVAGLSAVPQGALPRLACVAAGTALLLGARSTGGWSAIGMAGLGGLLVGRALARAGVGQLGRRRASVGRPVAEQAIDPVAEAGEASFPASDAPSWSPTSVGPPAHDGP